MISDFTTNLLKHHICKYTERFAVNHIDADLRKRLPINKALFNYDTENCGTGNLRPSVREW